MKSKTEETRERNVPEELPRPTQVTIVPAAPGFNRVTKVFDDDHSVIDLGREPIVAWAIETLIFDGDNKWGERRIQFHTAPITLGPSYGSGPNAPEYAVEYPDGQCVQEYVQMFDNAAGLLKWWQEYGER